ncbi:MAG: DUF3616 domain-containing protein [Rhodocyclaceae bacterium]|nr:DUF3616 domain-containing protein [Rhodocyclaceae bacterium]
MFLPLTAIYEPSAIQQLPDGRFLVVEDEKQHPLSLFAIGSDGHIESRPVDREADDALGKLDDLEGLSLDAAGNIYAIASHSRTGDGDEKKSRNKLVRFRIDGNRIVAATLVTDLKSPLVAAHPVLAKAAAILDVKAEGGLNIEAIEIAPDTQHLLIGFRSPLLDGRAIVARIDNPAAMFDVGEPPRVSSVLETLDLGGHGIRGMSWIPVLGGYLVISGPVAREQVQFRLWFWSGRHGDPARPVGVPGLPGFEHAEGVAPALIDGQQRIVIVSDDGSRAEGRCARYLLLDPAHLQIA